MPQVHKYRDPEVLGHLRAKLEARGWINLTGAAQLLQIHPQTASLQVKRGRLRAQKFGERYYVSLEEVDRYVSEGPLPKPRQDQSY